MSHAVASHSKMLVKLLNFSPKQIMVENLSLSFRYSTKHTHTLCYFEILRIDWLKLLTVWHWFECMAVGLVGNIRNTIDIFEKCTFYHAHSRWCEIKRTVWFRKNWKNKHTLHSWNAWNYCYQSINLVIMGFHSE